MPLLTPRSFFLAACTLAAILVLEAPSARAGVPSSTDAVILGPATEIAPLTTSESVNEGETPGS
jgi:hypothetical protein